MKARVIAFWTTIALLTGGWALACTGEVPCTVLNSITDCVTPGPEAADPKPEPKKSEEGQIKLQVRYDNVTFTRVTVSWTDGGVPSPPVPVTRTPWNSLLPDRGQAITLTVIVTKAGFHSCRITGPGIGRSDYDFKNGTEAAVCGIRGR